MITFHFIRPLWLLALLPLIGLFWLAVKQKPALNAWQQICDKTLLIHLIKGTSKDWRSSILILLFASAFCMVLSLSGPSWKRLASPSYANALPRVIVLDMSDAMLERDITPSRLKRAKFKLHDLFLHQDAGQFGLVVYTDEPFIVSPLTQDGETIDALLSALTPDIMPVDGQRLDLALDEAQKLVAQAGFKQGEILVMTSSHPSAKAIAKASALSKKGFQISIMPIRKDDVPDSLFQQFAQAGQGRLILLSAKDEDILQWLAMTVNFEGTFSKTDEQIQIWKDEGVWFLGLAILLLIPIFRRGYLQRIQV